MAQNIGADYVTNYGADYGADDRHRLQQNATRPKEGHAQNIQWHACMLSNILSRYIQNISTYKNILRSGAGMHMPVQRSALLPPSPDLEMPLQVNKILGTGRNVHCRYAHIEFNIITLRNTPTLLHLGWNGFARAARFPKSSPKILAGKNKIRA